MHDLLKIKLMDNMNGKYYQLIGFKSNGLDTTGYQVVEITLYDPNTQKIVNVTGKDLHRLSVITKENF
jgi:hypothetical protein